MGARPSQVATSQASKISATKSDPNWSAAYGKLPLSFEENQGQTAREVRFVSHGSGYELFLTPQEAVLTLRSNKPLDLSPLHRTASIRALRRARRAGQVTAIRIGAVEDRLVVRERGFALAPTAYVCASIDHRALDGMDAGALLAAMKKFLEAD